MRHLILGLAIAALLVVLGDATAKGSDWGSLYGYVDWTSDYRFYAMSSICTHQQVDMGTAGFTAGNLAAGFQCPVHHANYDPNGAVQSVAPSSLQHYGLTSDANGVLYVNTGMSVAATCRC